jgi:hypothetical protein
MYFLYWVIQTEAAVFQFHPYILLISDTLTFRFLSDLRTEKKSVSLHISNFQFRFLCIALSHSQCRTCYLQNR